MTFPIDAVRARFPALHVTDEDRARVYLDAPGGTQVCSAAIEAMTRHLSTGTANAGGAFATSVATDATSRAAHRAIADLIGAHPDEIAIGPNMTSLTFAASRALSRDWQPGDELVVTRLDHDANVAPWLAVAADRGMTVRWLDFDPADGRLCLDLLAPLLNDRTRLVAVGAASNALGTVNDVARIVGIVRSAARDALIYVDAVQSAPHLPIDVATLGCDLLACSPYKMFGPHAGVLWAKRSVVDRVEAYKVRPAGNVGMRRFETGTPSFEAQAGMVGMVDYLAWLGGELVPDQSDRRARLLAALAGCERYESILGERLLAGIAQSNAITLVGPRTMAGRVPTFAFTVEGMSSADVAQELANRGIFVWSGHFYAIETLARLDLADATGLVRVGFCHYNTVAEVDLLLAALADITSAVA